MTRGGSGGGPVEGRHGAPSTGRHADAEPAPGRDRGRHAAPEADGTDGRAQLERALRKLPPGGRRRARSASPPTVTESDDPPGRWNGVGPGALVLPARLNGRHGYPEAAAPAAPAVNGWHAPPEPPPGNGRHSPTGPTDDWPTERPTARPAPEPPPGNGRHSPTGPTDDWLVERPVPRPAGPERIGDLPPADDRRPDRRSARPPQPPAGVPLDRRRATQPYRSTPGADGPLPPPAPGRPSTEPRRPLNGHTPAAHQLGRQVGPAAHPLGQRVGPAAHPLDQQVEPAAHPLGQQVGPAAHPLGQQVGPVGHGDSTQLLRRYVPAQEMLDREDRQPAATRPPTRRGHPPRSIVRRRRARRRLLEWPVLIVFALLSAYLIRAYVVQTFYIPSGSMHETLLEGDRVLVNKVSYRLGGVDRGDVVVFRRPPDFPAEDEDLIKRVVALPGETVEARGRKVYVNGKPLAEPYVEPLCRGTQDFPAVTVPAGDLWVMGDNRCNSSDSRVFGPIEEDLVVGRAFVLAWPLARLSWL